MSDREGTPLSRVNTDVEDDPRDSNVSEEEEIDTTEQQPKANKDLELDVAKLSVHKRQRSSEPEDDKEISNPLSKKQRARSELDISEEPELRDEMEEDAETRRKREFEERFEALIKKPTKKRKNNDIDLEAFQDEAISILKHNMKEAALLDVDCVNQKKPATHKLKLLPQVRDTLLKSNLYDSILDNNMLEAVRIWLEPLPDSSLPAFEIQRTLFNELTKLPIKTIHLRESGLGKVMLFYQKSKKADPSLKRIAEKLIGDWTRPIMGRSDNYRAKKVQTINFDLQKFQADIKLRNTQQNAANKANKSQRKTLYQESADRRKRAAAPEQRTSVYTVAPQVDANVLTHQNNGTSIRQMGIGSSLTRDERFKKLNQKLNQMSQKKKSVKKGGVSIEGRGLPM